VDQKKSRESVSKTKTQTILHFCWAPLRVALFNIRPDEAFMKRKQDRLRWRNPFKEAWYGIVVDKHVMLPIGKKEVKEESEIGRRGLKKP